VCYYIINMEPDIIPQTLEKADNFASLKKITPLSKYLAMVLFIILPFLGGWIGYTYAPEKVVEIKIPILEDINIQNSENAVSSTILINNEYVASESSTNHPYFGLPLVPKVNVSAPFSIVEPKSPDNPKNVKYKEKMGSMEGEFSWGSGQPVIYVIETSLSEIADPDCEYGCVPENIARLDYYTYNNNSDVVLFYTEEMDVSRIQNAEYIILGYDYGEKFTFIQSINKRYCCDDSGDIINRVFDVNLRDNKIIVREHLDV
jgi:hypothetical protein